MVSLQWNGPGLFGGRSPGTIFEADDESAERWLRDLPGKMVRAVPEPSRTEKPTGETRAPVDPLEVQDETTGGGDGAGAGVDAASSTTDAQGAAPEGERGAATPPANVARGTRGRGRG